MTYCLLLESVVSITCDTFPTFSKLIRRSIFFQMFHEIEISFYVHWRAVEIKSIFRNISLYWIINGVSTLLKIETEHISNFKSVAKQPNNS